MSKSEVKIQALLSKSTLNKLNNIITATSLHRGKLLSVSGYVRELIENHIKEYEGEQTSIVNQNVKEIISNYKKNQK